MRDFPTGIWTTQDGRKIPITDLHSNHLTNIILMLRRRAVEHCDDYDKWIAESRETYPGATDEQILDGLCWMYFDEWDALIDEAEKRGLEVVKNTLGARKNKKKSATGIGWVVAGALFVSGLFGIIEHKQASKQKVHKKEALCR